MKSPRKMKHSVGYKQYIVSMTPELHELAQAVAAKKEQSFSGFIRTVLKMAMAAEAIQCNLKK